MGMVPFKGDFFNKPPVIFTDVFFKQTPSVPFRWDMTPQGTGAMGQKLDAEEVSRQILGWFRGGDWLVVCPISVTNV